MRAGAGLTARKGRGNQVWLRRTALLLATPNLPPLCPFPHFISTPPLHGRATEGPKTKESLPGTPHREGDGFTEQILPKNSGSGGAPFLSQFLASRHHHHPLESIWPSY